MSKAATARRHGFTLIELLVVISIVALLISLLLPSLQSARDVARMMSCQSRMRQFYVAGQAYVTEYGWWPPNSFSGIPQNTLPSTTFVNAMEGYIGSGLKNYRTTGPSENIWLCPANPIDGAMPRNPTVLNIAYTLETVLVGNYHTTWLFGYSASATPSAMVPIDMVPGPRQQNPKAGRPFQIIWLGELRSATAGTWPYGGGQQATYFHPQESTNLTTMDGAVRNSQGAIAGAPPKDWSEYDLQFWE